MPYPSFPSRSWPIQSGSEHTGQIDLQVRGIGEAKAAELRARLSAFAEEWSNLEMNLYDHYDAARSSPGGVDFSANTSSEDIP